MDNPIKPTKLATRMYRILYCLNPRELASFQAPTTYRRSDYLDMGIVEAKNLDHLFALLNDGTEEPNPFSDALSQARIRNFMAHTSMSVGDIAIDTTEDQTWYCASVGWTPILEAK